ncbi:MAG: hypothetical protein M1818_003549 [Claussenomyces sp. TS43310]|nr:MAG: hypothetical protein M1818_003549 [Claussenomyces sp. TS43310]
MYDSAALAREGPGLRLGSHKEVTSSERRRHSVSLSIRTMSRGGRPVQPQRNINQYVSRTRHSLVLVLIFLAAFLSLTSATISSPILSAADFNLQLSESHETFRSTLDDLAKNGIILVDQSAQPSMESQLGLRLERVEEDLRRRDEGRDADPFLLERRKEKSSSSASSTATATTITVATAAPASQLPSAFDSGLGSSFESQTCPSYIKGFLEEPKFKACLPLSMLLESSVSFFQVEKSIVRVTQTLDVACGANVTSCNVYLSTLANNLTTAANCAADYANGNSVVMQVYTGLISYRTMYQASCLRDPSTDSYCFADAITNSTSPTNSYIYYLPLNTSLPGGTNPTCNTCLQHTMAVFQTSAANRSQPVSSLYAPAAQQINAICGPGFLNTTVPVEAAVTSTSAVFGPYSHTVGLVALVMLVFGWVL